MSDSDLVRVPSVPESDPLPPGDRWPAPAAHDLERLYREQRNGLLRGLRRHVGFDHAADIVQQVFSRFAGLSLERRAGIASPAAYLRRSAKNLAIDHAKAEDRTQARTIPTAAEPRTPDQIAALEARDALRRLDIALQRLKPRTREIFLAHRVDGYSYHEIAVITGLSVKAVEKHMSRAIAFVDRTLSGR